MLFNSFQFLAFFAVVFGVYWFALKGRRGLQNSFLLASSCVFYMAFIPVYISILALTIAIDYIAAIQIEKASGEKRKAILAASVLSTCLVLFVFKYFNFFNASFKDVAALFDLRYPVGMTNLILPIGLSFHTFQSLGYVIDVYKGRQKAERDPVVYSLYVMFFPQLVAGPIERARHLLPQFHRPRHFDDRLASSGAKRVLLGYFKKIVIADNLAVLVNAVYDNPAKYPGFPMFVATVFFAFQIYCDFSGYSDIAVGVARLLGFELMENFEQPYGAASPADFWRRWHISLSSWFRDYVYIPLGGSEGTKAATAANILITFVLSGLWHGANWTFVVWGAYHGAIVAIERLLPQRPSGQPLRLAPKAASILATFSLVCFGWIFFRARSLFDAAFIIKSMFSDVRDYANPLKMAIKFRGMGLEPGDLLGSVLFILLLTAIEYASRKGYLEGLLDAKPALKWSYYWLLLTAIVFWGSDNSARNFIYFQF